MKKFIKDLEFIRENKIQIPVILSYSTTKNQCKNDIKCILDKLEEQNEFKINADSIRLYGSDQIKVEVQWVMPSDGIEIW